VTHLEIIGDLWRMTRGKDGRDRLPRSRPGAGWHPSKMHEPHPKTLRLAPRQKQVLRLSDKPLTLQIGKASPRRDAIDLARRG
jgi:hypothetical protein